MERALEVGIIEGYLERVDKLPSHEELIDILYEAELQTIVMTPSPRPDPATNLWTLS